MAFTWASFDERELRIFERAVNGEAVRTWDRAMLGLAGGSVQAMAWYRLDGLSPDPESHGW